MSSNLIYSKEQQIHCLSSMTSAGLGMKFDNFTEMQAYVTNIVTKKLANAAVQTFIGNWTLIWGPVVFCNNPAAPQVVADNTMMMLYSASQNLFVAAIAGTNLYSTYAWFQEDFHVSTTVNWSQVSGYTVPFATISTGSYAGLQVLLQMQSNSQTMLQALTAYFPNAKSGAEFATTGHSLGGALCPVLAVYMNDTMGTWNTNGTVTTISSWPTAGPTAGNQAFATYASTVLSYTSRVNTLDVVPLAWNTTTLAQIPALYEPNISPPTNSNPTEVFLGIISIVAVVNTINTSGSIPFPINYQQIQPWNMMVGTFNQAVDSKVTNELGSLSVVIPSTSALNIYIPYFVNVARFLAQMAYQHLGAYDILLNIQGFIAAYGVVQSQNPPPNGQTLEQAHRQALYAALAKTTGVASLANLGKTVSQNNK